jgi:uncharacterized protein involved in exopolysaccharide biosynthesis
METVSQRRVVDISLLARIIWQRRSLFASTAGAVVGLMVLYLHLTPVKFTVFTQVAPVVNSQNPISGSLGGLAKLAGVDVNAANPGAMQFRLFISALTARDTANLLARDQDLMKALFPKQWSSSENRWRQPPSLTRPVTRTIKAILGFPSRPWHPPDGSDVQQYLSDHLEIYEDPKGPVVTLRIDSDEPQVSRRLLQQLVGTVDQLLRQRALKRATDYVRYLSRELNIETVAEYRQTLMAHLAEQEQTLMMANAGVSFSMQIFNQPAVPANPSAPKALVLLITAMVLGMGFGGAMCLLAEARGWPYRPLPPFRSRASRRQQGAYPD